jgi:tetratricopeptide (TPR) repeat protein
MLGGRARVRRIVSSGSDSGDDATRSLLDELARLVGLARSPRLVVSPRAKTPFCIGFARPTIVLPEDTSVDDPALRMVLIHELIHLRHRDPLWNTLRRVVGALFFFHPGVYIAGRAYRLASEEICDGWTVHLTGKRRDYAECLASVAQTHVGVSSLGFAAPRKALGRRIYAILNGSHATPKRSRSRAASLVTVTLACVVGLAGVRLVGAAVESVGDRLDSTGSIDYEAALEDHRALVAREPSADNAIRLGELLYLTGDDSEARDAWDAVTEPGVQLSLARTLMRHAEWGRATDALTRAAATEREATVMYEVGMRLWRLDERDGAEAQFDRVLASTVPGISGLKHGAVPGAPDAAEYLSVQRYTWTALGRDHMTRDSEPWLPENKDEAYVGALLWKAYATQARGRGDAWLDELRDAVARKADDAGAHKLLAKAHLALGSKRQAFEALGSIAADTGDVTHLVTRLYLAGESKDVEWLAQNARALKAQSPQAYAWLLGRYGDLLPAAEPGGEIACAASLDLTTDEGFVTLGRLTRRLGSTPESEQLVRVALASAEMSHDPQNFAWRIMTEATRRTAHARSMAGDVDAAIDLLWDAERATRPAALPGAPLTAGLARSRTSHSGHYPLTSSFPEPTAHFDRERLSLIGDIYRQAMTTEALPSLRADVLRRSESAQPNDGPYASLALAYIQWWDGDEEDAEQTILRLRGRFPHDQGVAMNHAYLLIQRSRYDDALDLLKELTSTDPERQDEYLSLAMWVTLMAEDQGAARDIADRLLAIEMDADTVYRLANACLDEEMNDVARTLGRRSLALALPSGDVVLLTRLAQVLRRAGAPDAQRAARQLAMRLASRPDRSAFAEREWPAASHSEVEATGRKLQDAVDEGPPSGRAALALARHYARTRQPFLAEPAYARAVELRPDDLLLRTEYAQALAQANRPADATREYLRAFESSPGLVAYNSGYIAETFVKAGALDEVGATFVAMYKASRSAPVASLLQDTAAVALRGGRPQEAARLYEQYVQLSVDDRARAHISLAKAYEQAGEPEKAIAYLTVLTTPSATPERRPGDRLEFLTELTRLHRDAGSLRELRAQMLQRHTARPDDVTWAYGLALAGTSMGQPEDVQDALAQVLAATDLQRYGFAWRDLAQAFASAGDATSQMRVLRRGVRASHSTSFLVKMMTGSLAAALNSEGMRDEAKDALRQEALLYSMDWQAREEEAIELAGKLRDHGLMPVAERLLRRSFNDAVTHHHYRDEMRRAHARLEEEASGAEPADIASARAAAERRRSVAGQVVSETSDEQEARRQAEAAAQDGRYAEAIERWHALHEQHPDNARYLQHLAGAYTMAGRHDEHIAFRKTIVDASPSLDNRIGLARAYGTAGQFALASSTAEAALADDPDNEQTLAELARYQVAAGEYAAAESTLWHTLDVAAQPWTRDSSGRALVGVLQQLGKAREALTTAEQEGKLTRDMRIALAGARERDGDVEAAVKLYSEAAVPAEGGRMMGRNVGQLQAIYAYARMGLDDEAIALATSARGAEGMSTGGGANGFSVSLAGDHQRRALIDAYAAVGRLDRLAAGLDGKTDVRSLEIVADARRAQGDHAGALETYGTLIERQTRDFRYYFHAAVAAHRLGMADRATELAELGRERYLATHYASMGSWREVFAQILLGGGLVEAGTVFAREAHERPLDAHEREGSRVIQGALLAWAHLMSGDIEAANETIANFTGGTRYAAQTMLWGLIHRWVREPVALAVDEDAFLAFLKTLTAAPIDDTRSWFATQRKWQQAAARAGFHNARGEADKRDAALDAVGYLPDSAWRVIGPFPGEFGGENVSQDGAVDLTARHDGQEWQGFQDDAFDGFLDLGDAVGGDQVHAYAYTTITTPSARNAVLVFESEGWARVFLNGEEIHADAADGQVTRRVEHQSRITAPLASGVNHILVKCGDNLFFEEHRWPPRWGFYIQILDDDGEPFTDFSVAKNAGAAVLGGS